MLDVSALDFNKGKGVLTVVTQDARTCEVLMVAHADREAIEKTLERGEMHYHSRSRGLWRKGATSGNTQKVVSLTPDCDGDAIVAKVIPAGPACHLGMRSCFGPGSDPDALSALDEIIAQRASNLAPSSQSYTRTLLADRNLRFKKLGEEFAELLVAFAEEDQERALEEAADVFYHLLVALRSLGVGLEELRQVLKRRAGPKEQPTSNS